MMSLLSHHEGDTRWTDGLESPDTYVPIFRNSRNMLSLEDFQIEILSGLAMILSR
jgi:hypothetical protein